MILPNVLYITSDHALQGEKRDCSLCPIALAVKEYLNKEEIYFMEVNVYIDVVYIVYQDSLTEYYNHDGKEFIYSFDNDINNIKYPVIVHFDVERISFFNGTQVFIISN